MLQEALNTDTFQFDKVLYDANLRTYSNPNLNTRDRTTFKSW